jgi:hypothetical protein
MDRDEMSILYREPAIDVAVWDLNGNLDVFSMQTFLRGLIYVR